MPKIADIIMLVVKLGIAGVIGFWFYLDARGRDYAWMFWTFVPIILVITAPVVGILVLVVLLISYFVMRPRGVMSKCPHCKKKIIDNLFVCPFCQKNAKKECLVCHEPVPWEAEQCPHCKSRAITKS